MVIPGGGGGHLFRDVVGMIGPNFEKIPSPKDEGLVLYPLFVSLEHLVSANLDYISRKYYIK